MPALGGTSAPKGRVSRESEMREVWRPLGSGIGLATKPHRPVIEYWRIRRKEITSLLIIALRCARKTFGCTLCSSKPQAVFVQKPKTDLDHICRESAPAPTPHKLRFWGVFFSLASELDQLKGYPTGKFELSDRSHGRRTWRGRKFLAFPPSHQPLRMCTLQATTKMRAAAVGAHS